MLNDMVWYSPVWDTGTVRYTGQGHTVAGIADDDGGTTDGNMPYYTTTPISMHYRCTISISMIVMPYYTRLCTILPYHTLLYNTGIAGNDGGKADVRFRGTTDVRAYGIVQ